jgi:5-methylcytosine-specific restriction enzyme A
VRTLVDGIRLHRDFGKRSVTAYNSHLSNGIDFACVKDGHRWTVEPLGWALLLARGGDAEIETKSDPHGEAEMRPHVSIGWQRVHEGDGDFDAPWEALRNRLGQRKIGLSSRKGPKAVFWIAPSSIILPDRTSVLAIMERLAAGERPTGFGEARVWFVRHPEYEALYPAKVVWGLATGQTGRDFISHRARDNLRKLGFDVPGPDQPASEIAESPESLANLPRSMEGAERQVTRNERERDPAARREAEAHWRVLRGGLICEGCNIDFGQTYGARGEGFMHFHHLAPLASATGPREINGPTDLVPLCPNCHAMVHRGESMWAIDELKNNFTDRK